MSYALLWLETLTIYLLLGATVIALISHIQRPRLRMTLRALAVAPIFVLLLLATVATGVMKFATHLEPNWFYYLATLLVIYTIVYLSLSNRAGRAQPGMRPAGVEWSAPKLALATLISAAFCLTTVWNMDLGIRLQGVACGIEAGASFAELAPSAPADRENAAITLEKAFVLYKDDADFKNDDGAFGAEITAPATPQLRASLHRLQPALLLLHQAAQMPYCRFDRDWGHPSVSMLLPQLAYIREGQFLLGFQSRVDLEDGQISRAIADVNDMYRLAQQIGQEPIVVSGLVSIGMDEKANQALESVLPKVDSASQLDQLHLPDEAEIRTIMLRAVRGERSFGLATWSQLVSGEITINELSNPGNATPSPSLDLERSTPVQVVERLFLLSNTIDAYRSAFDALVAASALPYPRYLEQENGLLAAQAQQKYQGIFNSIMLPNLTRFFERGAMGRAGLSCAAVAVAATRYRLEHGQLPQNLGDLVPQYLAALPRDPYTDQSLHLSTLNGKWVVYSIGPDMKDEDGKPLVDNSLTHKWEGNTGFTLRTASGTAQQADVRPK